MATTQQSDEFEVDEFIEATELSSFQRDILTVLSHRPEGMCGMALQSRLHDLYGESINHSRVYQNLRSLKEMGYLTKSEVDGRTNNYRLNETGEALLQQYHGWQLTGE